MSSAPAGIINSSPLRWTGSCQQSYAPQMSLVQKASSLQHRCSGGPAQTCSTRRSCWRGSLLDAQQQEDPGSRH